MNKFSQYFIVVVSFFLSSQVNATIITFDDNNIRNTGIYIEGNFKITAPVGLVNGKLNLDDSPHLVDNDFSGRYMETWNTEAVFSLEEVSGKAFDLIGLDIGSYFGKSDDHLGLAAWTFTGFNGRTEIFSLVNPESFGHLSFDWTDLTRVTIQSYRASAASAFDNIEVFVPPVIVPPTLLASTPFTPLLGTLSPSVGQVNSVDVPQPLLLIVLALTFIIFRRSGNFSRRNIFGLTEDSPQPTFR